MVVEECAVEGVADPEGFEVGFEGVTRGCTWGFLGVRVWRCVWISARVVAAMTRDVSVMPDHLDGRWSACVGRRGKQYFVR